MDLTVMVPSFLQFLNTLLPICVTPVPIVVLLSFVHPSKEDVPIVFTLFPIPTLDIGMPQLYGMRLSLL